MTRNSEVLTSHGVFVSKHCLNKSQSLCLMSLINLVKLLGVVPTVCCTSLFVYGVIRLTKIHQLFKINLCVAATVFFTTLFVVDVGFAAAK